MEPVEMPQRWSGPKTAVVCSCATAVRSRIGSLPDTLASLVVLFSISTSDGPVSAGVNRERIAWLLLAGKAVVVVVCCCCHC